MTATTEANHDEVQKEAIKSVTDVFNKGINGNPLAFVSALLIIMLCILFLAMFGSNIYFQYQRVQSQQSDEAKMEKNNEILKDILDANMKEIQLLHELVDANRPRRGR